MHLYTSKHQLTLTFKTLKKLLKNISVEVTPTYFGPLIRPSWGGAYAILSAVTRLSSADLLSLIVLCGMWLYVLIVSLCAWPVVLSGWDLVMAKHSITRSHPDKSTGHAHKLTISTYSHIPHKTINERKSAELNRATALSTKYAPPEDGRISGPKYVGVLTYLLHGAESLLRS